MEDVHFDPEFNWSPDAAIRLDVGNLALFLQWHNTHVYRFLVEDGRYDFVDHDAADGTNYQIFLDATELSDDLDRRGYTVTTSAFVDDEIVESRRDFEMEIEAATFAQELGTISGPDDLLEG